MVFRSIEPTPALSHHVREYWIYEDDNPSPARQKIIPDGYCEIIIHYGDPYRICLYDTWEEQSSLLLSGQISRFFYLENTGRSAMLGIKLHPVAVHVLFGCDMTSLTDQVIPLEKTGCDVVELLALAHPGITSEQRLAKTQQWLLARVTDTEDPPGIARIRSAVDLIFRANGLVNIEDIARDSKVTRRHLERTFLKVVGLSPKYFARIIQFGYIFKAIEAGDASWVDVALNSGYFDQSHFIKNFAAFTGELPTQYGFDEESLANFFMRR